MWWNNLTDLQQISFIFATVATVLMILMIVMMIIGMDGAESFDGDIDFDADIDFDDIDGVDGIDEFNNDSIISIGGLKIVTLRGVLAFFSIGGWMIYALGNSLDTWLVILIGVITGAIASVLLAVAMKAIYRLESSGNLDYHSAIGKRAEVYIRIPKQNSGKGKVMLNHQGRLIEVDAVTKSDIDLLSKQEVVITGLLDDTTLVVKNIKEEE